MTGDGSDRRDDRLPPPVLGRGMVDEGGARVPPSGVERTPRVDGPKGRRGLTD
ncbi:hypothetical protein [Thermomonospora umbrina]|uniref:Uncharacterized protein n=1 Tax=Thermomonospora umbrina TaxID=111806 RepID=A0A3D9T7K0_9ACTN|nr:hypothetical protein [Thermomonospora umbrina]REE99751.1 hypothetical protein DFJ69_5267 [Thermomonospora umbrina]